MIGSYECACNSGYKFATGDETDPYHEDRGCIGEFCTLVNQYLASKATLSLSYISS